MTRNQSISDGNLAQSSAKAGSSCLPLAGLKAEIKLLGGWPSLKKLAESLQEDAQDYSPLTLDQFEMLEAELQNQGILKRASDGSGSISRHSVHEANFWRWRARRYGAGKKQFEFYVDPHRYIIWRAFELLSICSNSNTTDTKRFPEMLANQSSFARLHQENKQNAEAELRYLEQFAAYLTGAFDNSANRFQQGLNLVLRVIGMAKKNVELIAASYEDSTPKTLNICLPVSREEFLDYLRNSRDTLE